jgi:hypothetical protein
MNTKLKYFSSIVTFLLRQKSNQKRQHKNIGSAIFVGYAPE